MNKTSKRALYGGLGILILLIVFYFGIFSRWDGSTAGHDQSQSEPAVEKAGEVRRIIPAAWVDRAASDPLPLAAMSPVHWGDEVRTEPDGRLQLVLSGGDTVNLGSSARLQIFEQTIQSEQSEYMLATGKLRAYVRTTNETPFRIRTTTAIVGVIGTHFYVGVTPEQTTVISIAGTVRVRNAQADIPGEVILQTGEKTVVLIGEPPTPAQAATGEEIKRAIADTSAGPANWQAVLLPDEEIGGWSDWMNSIEFLNDRDGWAVGHSSEWTGIFRTRDGGESWERFTFYDGTEHPPDFKEVRFWDAAHGWIASGSLLLYTSDGGETWVPVDVPNSSYYFLNCLLPVGPQTVIAGRNDGWILITDPSGNSVHEVQLAPGAKNVAGLTSSSTDTLFAVTASTYLDKGSLYRSEDGGRSWTQVLTGKQPLRGIAFSGERGVIVGDSVAYWTEDGGANWQRTIFPARHFGVVFVGETTVVSVGEKPHALISHDGGKNWQVGPTLSGSSALSDIAIVHDGLWFATGGYDPAVYRFLGPF